MDLVRVDIQRKMPVGVLGVELLSQHAGFLDDIDGVFDTRDESALAAEGMDAASLADNTWRDQMKATGEARTQAFARGLIAKGYRAMFVRSFAPGATKDDLNLVLWQWGDSPPSRLTLIDDENRLSR